MSPVQGRPGTRDRAWSFCSPFCLGVEELPGVPCAMTLPVHRAPHELYTVRSLHSLVGPHPTTPSPGWHHCLCKKEKEVLARGPTASESEL